ncbi:MAG: alpha/beta fold hydrolase [Deltaproteobacteria bacterium]|nr:alpha/beta fold hydrolase [Deltaproteobacteria bacterium]
MAATVIPTLTSDGWQLPLHFYGASRSSFAHPVLMVHGLGANRLNLDLDARLSIARAARDRGFNVYLLELRGAGMSEPPQGKERGELEWGFGEHRDLDLPAALKAVLAHSGATAVHAFGHSMGGMLVAAMAAGTAQHRIRSLTAVASPLVKGLELAPRERRLLEVGARLAPANPMRHVPLKPLMLAAGSVISFSAKLVDGMLLNAQNCDDEVMARMAKEGIADVPVKLLLQIAAQLSGEASEGLPFEHEDRLGRVRVPAFVVSGSVDRVAPKAAVQAFANRLGSKDLRYREMGRSFGDGTDYGHGDLLVGRNAPEEVFPLLLDFLEQVD